MIQAYIKLFNNTNRAYIYENPSRNNFMISRGGGDIKQMPTLDMAILYRQSFLANEALCWLTHTFKAEIFCPEIYHYMIGYTNKHDTEVQELAHEVSLLNAGDSEGLIYLDLCLDNKEDTYYQEVKDAFLANNQESNIFVYSELKTSSTKQQELQTLINSL